MTAHSELLARLEGASEGSRELDARIWCTANGFDFIGMHNGWFVAGKNGAKQQMSPPEPLTTSLDAALALAERLGWPFWSGGQGTSNAWAHLYDQHPDQDGPTHNANAATPALALCIAILKATATGPQPDDGEKT